MKNIIFDISGVLFYYNKLDMQNILLNKETNPFEKIESGHNILYSCFNKTDSNGKKQFSLYVLSNFNRSFFDLLMKHQRDTFSLFDGIVISGDVGFKKPDMRIYLYLISKYNLEPQECLMIDDQYDNIQSAQQIGMKGVLFDKHLSPEFINNL